MELLHPKCAGLDVHKDSVVACVRIQQGPQAVHQVKTFGATTQALLQLSDWLTGHQVTDVAMEATGVYWKPVWHVLDGTFDLVLANAMHIKNVPGRKTDVNDATWIADLLAHGFLPSPGRKDRSRDSSDGLLRASGARAQAESGRRTAVLTPETTGTITSRDDQTPHTVRRPKHLGD